MSTDILDSPIRGGLPNLASLATISNEPELAALVGKLQLENQLLRAKISELESEVWNLSKCARK